MYFQALTAKKQMHEVHVTLARCNGCLEFEFLYLGLRVIV